VTPAPNNNEEIEPATKILEKRHFGGNQARPTVHLQKAAETWIQGANIMLTNLSDFRQFSAIKLAFFLKPNVSVLFFNNLALF
jgi:hypothetical protein